MGRDDIDAGLGAAKGRAGTRIIWIDEVGLDVDVWTCSLSLSHTNYAELQPNRGPMTATDQLPSPYLRPLPSSSSTSSERRRLMLSTNGPCLLRCQSATVPSIILILVHRSGLHRRLPGFRQPGWHTQESGRKKAWGATGGEAAASVLRRLRSRTVTEKKEGRSILSTEHGRWRRMQ